MKKILNILLILTIILGVEAKVFALNFEEAFAQADKKPMVVLVYAQWAEDYQSSLQQYQTIKKDFSNKFNFVELDIATKEAKAFNDKFHIYPKLPYVLMFRDGGKVSRYIPRDCTTSASCMSSKLKSFIQ